MKKVGIITLYKNNRNYGGLLQAYALNEVITQFGFSSEIINYEQDKKTYRLNRFRNLGVNRTLEFMRNRFKTELQYRLKPELKNNVSLRNKWLHDFEVEIPHSETVSDSDIATQTAHYDYLICGSDQIWNPGLWSPVMFLDIKGFSGKRISYAASVGRGFLTDKEKDYIREHISVIDAISVRETSAAKLIQPLTDKKVEVVLDPTLLLKKDDWQKFARKPDNLPENFVFSFFLGDNGKIKKRIYDMYRGDISVVTIPHLQTGYKGEDEAFSDIQLYKIGPREWVWLILNAEKVFTDSFHGTAFSVNLGKDFYSFPKGSNNDSQSINSRLMDLLHICKTEGRFVNDINNLEKIVGASVDWVSVDQTINKKRAESIDFLNMNLY